MSATTQIEFYFVSIPFLIIRVSECLSLIVDDHVYTGGETRVNSSLFFFFCFEFPRRLENFVDQKTTTSTVEHDDVVARRFHEVTIRICPIRSLAPPLPL